MALWLDQECCCQREQSCCATTNIPPTLHTDITTAAPEKGTKEKSPVETLLGGSLIHFNLSRAQFLIEKGCYYIEGGENQNEQK